MTSWGALFAFAVLRLGLSPAAFWALSIVEWRALAKAGAPVPQAMNREGLMALIKQYGGENA